MIQSHILIAMHVILRTRAIYEDLGTKDFHHWDRQSVVRRAIRRLESLGYRVSEKPATPEAS